MQPVLLQPFEPFYTTSGDDDTTLVFESRFESGNLLDAVQVGDSEYDLRMRCDLFSNRHLQWFYFRISNTRKGQSYRMNITNFSKKHSLFSHGMQPVFYSTAEFARSGTGWYRDGSNVRYYTEDSPRLDHKGRPMRTLTFTFTARHDNDSMYIANAVPYTYSDLREFIHALLSHQSTAQFMKRRVMCSTRAGNDCDLLTITNFDDPPEATRAKKGVFLSARVHPGETVSSWCMKGTIEFLLSEHPDAVVLRQNFVFKIVPMLNPDGVIIGNSRVNLTGVDLNRNYREPHELLHPTIYFKTEVLAALQRERIVVLYVDMHGHSLKFNTFLYGCHNLEHPTLRFTVCFLLLYQHLLTFTTGARVPSHCL